MREGVLQGMDMRLHKEVTRQSLTEVIVVMVISWLQLVPSVGLSPVPLGGFPHLAMSVSPSSGLFLQPLSVPRAFPT